jgi:hypothetical protein
LVISKLTWLDLTITFFNFLLKRKIWWCVRWGDKNIAMGSHD